MQKSAASFLRPLSFFLGCCDPPPPAQQPGLSWFLGSWAGPARCPCLDHVPSGWDPQQVDLGVCLGAPPCSSKDRFDLFRGVAAKFSLESPALTPLLSQNCCLAISAWASLHRRCFQREPYSPPRPHPSVCYEGISVHLLSLEIAANLDAFTSSPPWKCGQILLFQTV